MQNIYDTFNTATKGITAYAIMKDGKYIAKIVFKRVSSVTCYLHVLGHNMVSGKANGGGYDMCTASAAHAADKLRVTLTITEDPAGRQIAHALQNASHSWDRYLTDAGFTVHQVI